MVGRFQSLKRGLIGCTLLIIGFGAGWLSANVLGNHLPLDGDVASLFGPGRTANQATPAQIRDQFGVFWEVWNLVEGEFYHRAPLDRQRMIRGAISGMLGALDDQYTVYQEPDLAAQTNDHMNGKLAGIGIYLRIANGRAYIYRPIKNSPAVRAGLQQDDEIVKVDDQEIEPLIAGMEGGEASVKVAARIRGEPGTQVALRIRRAADGTIVDITITREDVVVPSVDSQLLDGQIAYLRITEFKATTTGEFDAALRELLPRQPKALILDLRNNPGGFLNSAREVLGRLYDGVALYEENSAGDISSLDTIAGALEVRVSPIPMVVLTNGGSASASEIVAGALRDARPATYLLGEKTYGKGSVQNIHTLSDRGSARITIAHWLTPNKNTIHKIGITPQYLVPYAEDPASPVPCVANRQPPAGQTTCADSQLAWAIKLLETGQTPPAVTPTPATN
jgi:carboxyl-terminal processing protease